MRIEFHGAARTVTGSMHLLHMNGSRILLDCGLYQGKRQEANEHNRTFPFDPTSIDAVILSHAHIDHSGNIPGLVKGGFRGPVYCTPATKDLCDVMLADSGHIQEKDAEFLNRKLSKNGGQRVEPLYTFNDAVAAREHFRGVPYGSSFDVVKNVTARFTDAGHILGSAAVTLAVREDGSQKTLGFTGDIGRWNMPIIRDPEFPGNVEVLLSESTYGGIVHDPPEEMGLKLAGSIRETFARGGKVIVPAFSVGRTQDIVFCLHKLMDAGTLPAFPVYIDSPLAINATEIFKRHSECFDEEMRTHILEHHDPLGMSQLHYVRSAEESKSLNQRPEPCMIIAASGMCEAGRILHHLANNITDPRNTIIIVGYQADHTLGRRLVDKADEVRIYGEFYKRKADVVVLNSFSAHADGNELLRYLGAFDRKILQRLFIVHGEYARQCELERALEGSGFSGITVPSAGETYDY